MKSIYASTKIITHICLCLCCGFSEVVVYCIERFLFSWFWWCFFFKYRPEFELLYGWFALSCLVFVSLFWRELCCVSKVVELNFEVAHFFVETVVGWFFGSTTTTGTVAIFWIFQKRGGLCSCVMSRFIHIENFFIHGCSGTERDKFERLFLEFCNDLNGSLFWWRYLSKVLLCSMINAEGIRWLWYSLSFSLFVGGLMVIWNLVAPS